MFHIGIESQRTPDERHRRRASQRRREDRRIPAESKPVEQWNSFSERKSWNLIPKDKFTNKGLYFSMSFDYQSFAHRYGRFQHFIQTFGIGIGTPKLTETPLTKELYAEAKEKYFLNQKLRFAFKRLVSAYLKKTMKIKNELDTITFEPPKQAVFLYDHANRCKFQFEAKELLRDFSTRLLTHEDLFPMPLFPRNPLTNGKLHLGQLLSLYSQIKAFGQMHWTLECFQDARFTLHLFFRDNLRKLRISALRDVMRSPQASDFILDFIEAQHDIYNKQFDLRTYQWALRTNKCHSMDRIRSWKSMCFTFYEIEITEDDLFERQQKMRKLTPLLLKLCSPCLEIQQVKRTLLAPKS